jgi:Baseplate J-like protein
MSILNQENLEDRARDLDGLGLNGIEFVIVTLEDGPPPKAILEVHFYNYKELDNIRGESPSNFPHIFPITGGARIIGGDNPGQIKVTDIEGSLSENFLKLTVSPIGDYSVYVLSVNYTNIDPHPFFSKVDFKFRPGCFNIDCKPELNVIVPDTEPIIDYLAKDFDSFKHAMITFMMQKVPGWISTSEADLDQTLLELFSAGADELSDYQDRVMNEAYLLTAKNRISLAKISKLTNYFIYQGNQAHTFIAINVNQEIEINKTFEAWTDGVFDKDTGTFTKGRSSIIFSSNDYTNPKFKRPKFYPSLNNIKLYTWSDSLVGLKTGTRTADLAIRASNGGTMPIVEVKEFEERINKGDVPYLLIQAGNLADSIERQAFKLKDKRQLVHLKKALAIYDPATTETLLRVWWRESLNFDICPESLTLFHGNIFQVYQGQVTESVFREYRTDLKPEELYYERITFGNETVSRGAICKISEPILYQETKEGGEIPPVSTLRIRVRVNVGSLVQEQEWLETPDLVHSTGLDNHYVVETDEDGMSSIRFGNGINGKELPFNADVLCSYMKGSGPDGNIGGDTLTYFNNQVDFPNIDKNNCWNPFDVNNGKKMEPASDIVRRVPEAFKSRQRRAVTLQDYVDRAEEISGVSKASAEYQWTGSWRTVRISVDPEGGFDLDQRLIGEISKQLMAVKLLGEDFEVRRAHYIPLEIEVTYCVDEDYWVEDLQYVVEQEFSIGYTPDGRPGFFNPDMWTFGQGIYRSQIIGRLESITGVNHVIELKMKKRYEPAIAQDFINIAMNEILQVVNDHDYPERGSIHFIAKGGRR